MKKVLLFLAGLLCAGVIGGCGHQDPGPAGVNGNTAIESPVETAESEVTEEAAGPVLMHRWKITLPDDSWTGEYKSVTQCWELNKEGCFDDLNKTMTIELRDESADEAMLASMKLSGSMGGAEATGFEYEIDGVSCPAYELYLKEAGKKTAKVFYPLEGGRCLEISMFVKKGDITGIDPGATEVKQIIGSLVADNRLNEESPADAENENKAPAEIVEIDNQGLSFEGEVYEGDNYRITLAEGWNVIESSYGSTFVIKGGETTNDYGFKPSLCIYYNQEDVFSSLVGNKAYYPENEDVSVVICGTEYSALRFTEEMVKDGKYWTHLKVFLPISDMENISVDIIVGSSEFEALGLEDDDVRMMLISLERSLSNDT